MISSPGSSWALRLANIGQRNCDLDPGLVKDDFSTILSLQFSF